MIEDRIATMLAGCAETKDVVSFEQAVEDVGDQVVYCVQVAPCGPIKIGLSTRGGVASRLKSLQTGSPWPLRLTRIVPGDRRVEERMHFLFGPLRMCGEWFYPHPALAAVAHAEAFA